MKYYCKTCGEDKEEREVRYEWKKSPEEKFTFKQIEIEHRILSCHHEIVRETGKTRNGAGR
jgi:hypothetical protein